MWKSVGRAPVFASFTLALALQLRKKHGKTSVRVRKTSVRLRRTSVRKLDGLHGKSGQVRKIVQLVARRYTD